MTALQDWLNIRHDLRPDPRGIKSLVCGVIRVFNDEQPKPEPATAEPVLMGRGLERC
ncbi:hypothetical protein [Mycolicibacterium sp. XJ1819]